MSSQSKKHKAKGKIHRWFRSGKELKNTNKCRGLHFYNSANRQQNKKILNEEIMAIDESKYKGQDKYCVACDTSDKKDYASVVIIPSDQKLTKSELIKHCEKEIEFHPKNSRRYKEHYILLCFPTGLPVETVNEFIDGKPEQVFLLPK